MLMHASSTLDHDRPSPLTGMDPETGNIDTTGFIEQYARAAYEAGCPRDQFENFLRASIVLQPKQLRMSAAARMCDSPDGPREVGVGGARGPGKSYWGLAQIAADDCQRFPGCKFIYLRKVGKSIRESFEDLRISVLREVAHEYVKGDGVVNFDNGSRIFLGHFQNENDIDAYLGLEYDAGLIEEATTLQQSKYRAVRSCIRTSKRGWRPRTYNTTNPGNIGHVWYKKRFVAPYRLNKETTTRFIPATLYDNQFINPEYRQDMEELTGWQYKAWVLGDWDIAAGQFFTTFRNEVHVVPNFTKDTLPKGWRFWGALDYGFTHFTVFLLFAKDEDGNLWVIDEHAQRGWLAQRHAPAITAMLDRYGLNLKSLRTIVTGSDCFAKKNDGATVAETYRGLGIKLKPANMDRINGAAEILVRLGDTEEFEKDPEKNFKMKPKLYICQACANTVEQIPAMQHDPHRGEDVLKVDCDEDGLGGDDGYDTLRYGVMVDWKPPRNHMRMW